MIIPHGVPIRSEQSGLGTSKAFTLPECSRSSHTRHVLVMDDDELVCSSLGLLLATMGYRVTLTKDSQAAIHAYHQAMMRKEPIDVVILDLHLPSGLDGKETVKKLLSLDPGVKAVVSSGDTTDPCMTDFKNFGFKYMLAKPVIFNELNAVLSALAPLQE